MTLKEIEEVMADLNDWMREAQNGPLKASEVRRIMRQIARLEKVALGAVASTNVAPGH